MEAVESQTENRRPQIDSGDEKINVRLKVVKTFYLTFKKSECIKNVKALFQEKEGLSRDSQEIVFAGDQLKDAQQLDHYGINNNATLDLFVSDHVGMNLFIKLPPDGRIFVVKASPDDTVHKIKELIQTWENIRSDSFTLVHNGILLEDHWTLVLANILRKNSFLNLVFCPKDVLSITVRSSNGEILKLNVKPMFSIRDVKEILGGMIDIPISKHSLYYGTKQLEDCKTLAFYDIKEESILELASSFRIFVQNWNGELTSHDVNKFTTVRDVVESSRDSYRFSNQYLFQRKNQLDDHKTLASYEIKEGSTLEMVPSYQIFVKTFYSGTVVVDVYKYNTVKDMKQKLFDKLNVALAHQVIRFKGKILQDSDYLSACGIEKNCDLDLDFLANMRS